MQELTQIDAPSAHRCEAPSFERWQVLEPVTGHWSWLTIYRCCSQVFEEAPPTQAHPPAQEIKKAA